MWYETPHQQQVRQSAERQVATLQQEVSILQSHLGSLGRELQRAVIRLALSDQEILTIRQDYLARKRQYRSVKERLRRARLQALVPRLVQEK